MAKKDYDEKALERRRQFAAEYGVQAPKSLCSCGHTGDGNNSEHEDTFQIGHGACRLCPCAHFTWVGWTPAFEKGLPS